MWKITRKLMANNAKMLVPAGIAVCIGTIFIAATLLFGNSLNATLRSQISAEFGQGNYAIQSDSNDDTPQPSYGEIDMKRIESLPAVTGVREGWMRMVTMSANGHNVNMPIIPNAADSTMMPVQLTKGTYPLNDQQIAIPADSASQLGITAGDNITVQAVSLDETNATPSATYQVSGLLEDPEQVYTYFGGAGIVSQAAYQQIDENVSGPLNKQNAPSIYLRIDMGQAQAHSTLTTIKSTLPKGVELTDKASFETERIKALGGSAGNFVTTFMLVFAAIAMFVAALVIANTFQVLVAQRRRVLALLRTVGAQRGQLYRSVLLEAALLGLISTLTGLLIAVLAIFLLAQYGANLPIGQIRFVMTPQVVLVPILFGMAVTILASLGSAKAATSVSALEALAPVEISDEHHKGKARVIVSLIMIIVGVLGSAAAAYGAWYTTHTSAANNMQDGTVFTTILFGAMAASALAFIGILISTSRWMPHIQRAVGAVVSHFGPASNVACANVRKNPRRIAATSIALLIGITLVATLGTGALSVRRSLAQTLDEHYSVDVEVSGPKDAVNNNTLEAIRKVEGVKNAVIVDTVDLKDKNNESTYRIYLVSSVQETQAVMNGNSINELKQGILYMPKYFFSAETYNLKAGEKLNLVDPSVIAARYSSDENGVPQETGESSQENENASQTENSAASTVEIPVTIQPANYRGLSSYVYYGIMAAGQFDTSNLSSVEREIWVKANGEVDANTLTNGIRQAVDNNANVSVGGSIAERSYYDQMISVMLNVMVALLAVALIIAIIGVANTLSLSVIERTRESATLRALGMTRGQLRLSLAVEAIMIALVSSIIGIAIGTLLGWLGAYIVCSAMGSVALAFDWAGAGLIVLVALVCALLASVLPARRAVRTAPVEALAEA